MITITVESVGQIGGCRTTVRLVDEAPPSIFVHIENDITSAHLLAPHLAEVAKVGGVGAVGASMLNLFSKCVKETGPMSSLTLNSLAVRDSGIMDLPEYPQLRDSLKQQLSKISAADQFSFLEDPTEYPKGSAALFLLANYTFQVGNLTGVKGRKILVVEE